MPPLSLSATMVGTKRICKAQRLVLALTSSSKLSKVSITHVVVKISASVRWHNGVEGVRWPLAELHLPKGRAFDYELSVRRQQVPDRRFVFFRPHTSALLANEMSTHQHRVSATDHVCPRFRPPDPK